MSVQADLCASCEKCMQLVQASLNAQEALPSSMKRLPCAWELTRMTGGEGVELRRFHNTLFLAMSFLSLSLSLSNLPSSGLGAPVAHASSQSLAYQHICWLSPSRH